MKSYTLTTRWILWLSRTLRNIPSSAPLKICNDSAGTKWKSLRSSGASIQRQHSFPFVSSSEFKKFRPDQRMIWVTGQILLEEEYERMSRHNGIISQKVPAGRVQVNRQTVNVNCRRVLQEGSWDYFYRENLTESPWKKWICRRNYRLNLRSFLVNRLLEVDPRARTSLGISRDPSQPLNLEWRVL